MMTGIILINKSYRGRDDDRDYIDKQIISVKYVWFKGLMMTINDDEDDDKTLL